MRPPLHASVGGGLAGSVWDTVANIVRSQRALNRVQNYDSSIYHVPVFQALPPPAYPKSDPYVPETIGRRPTSVPQKKYRYYQYQSFALPFLANMAYRKRYSRRMIGKRRRYRRRKFKVKQSSSASLPKVARCRHRIDWMGLIGAPMDTTTAYSDGEYYGNDNGGLVVSCSRLHDPFQIPLAAGNSTLTGHTPTMFDTMSLLYQTYTVRSVMVVVDFHDARPYPTIDINTWANTGIITDRGKSSAFSDANNNEMSRNCPLICSLVPADSTDTLFTDYPYRVGAKVGLVRLGGNRRMVYKFRPSQYVGQKASLSNPETTIDSGEFNNNSYPTKQTVLRVQAIPTIDPGMAANGTTPFCIGRECFVRVKVYYDVLWGNPAHMVTDN